MEERQQPEASQVGQITERPWGVSPQGEPITLFELETPSGYQASITNYGGVIVRLTTPDRNGVFDDIVLGHDHAGPYFSRDSSPFFGALIGRYGNRIARGRFTLNGSQYQLSQNNGPNALHGGERGFDQRTWNARPMRSADGPGVELTYDSPDGEEGYPGRLSVRVTYTLTTGGALRIDYAASTDAPTIVNLTNHTYFNLTGSARRDILDHHLTLHADAITPVDDTLIPTGEFMPVDGTPFDFRTPRAIGTHVNDDHPQLRHAGGYDHNFVLRGGPELRPVAVLFEPSTGREMTVHTTEPGVQFYSGNFLDGSITGKGGRVYGHRWALCLETQHYPDSPNHPHFPSTLLEPGHRYSSSTVYAFATR